MKIHRRVWASILYILVTTLQDVFETLSRSRIPLPETNSNSEFKALPPTWRFNYDVFPLHQLCQGPPGLPGPPPALSAHSATQTRSIFPITCRLRCKFTFFPDSPVYIIFILHLLIDLLLALPARLNNIFILFFLIWHRMTNEILHGEMLCFSLL